MVVRGRDTRAPEESKEKSLLGAYEIGSEGFSGFKTKRPFADGMEFPDKSFFDLGRPLPGNIAGFELLSRIAEL